MVVKRKVDVSQAVLEGNMTLGLEHSKLSRKIDGFAGHAINNHQVPLRTGESLILNDSH